MVKLLSLLVVFSMIPHANAEKKKCPEGSVLHSNGTCIELMGKRRKRRGSCPKGMVRLRSGKCMFGGKKEAPKEACEEIRIECPNAAKMSFQWRFADFSPLKNSKYGRAKETSIKDGHLFCLYSFHDGLPLIRKLLKYDMEKNRVKNCSIFNNYKFKCCKM